MQINQFLTRPNRSLIRPTHCTTTLRTTRPEKSNVSITLTVNTEISNYFLWIPNKIILFYSINKLAPIQHFANVYKWSRSLIRNRFDFHIFISVMSEESADRNAGLKLSSRLTNLRLLNDLMLKFKDTRKYLFCDIYICYDPLPYLVYENLTSHWKRLFELISLKFSKIFSKLIELFYLQIRFFSNNFHFLIFYSILKILWIL